MTKIDISRYELWKWILGKTAKMLKIIFLLREKLGKEMWSKTIDFSFNLIILHLLLYILLLSYLAYIFSVNNKREYLKIK